MITPSFALTATERVLPNMALDFTTAALDPRVTFTRSGNTATVTNSSGYVVPINANLPRFDFDPIALTCKGLLIEESRTNNLLYGSDLTQATWTKNSATVAANAATGPDNTTSASSYIPDNGATVECLLASAIIITANKDFTISGFFKKIGNAAGVALYTSQSNNGFRIGLDFSTGLISYAQPIGTGTLRNYGVQAYPNGWYRIWASGRLGVGGVNGQFRFILADANGANIAGNGTDGMYFYGGQFENSTVDISFVTSYIPTVASTVTRNADVATMTGTNFSDWYKQAEGTAVVSTTTKQITNEFDYANFAQTGSDDNRVRLYCSVGSAVNVTQITAATTSYFVIAGALVLGDIIVATGYKVSDSNMTQNKTNGADNTSVVAPTSINKLFIGCFADNVNAINGWVKKIQYYPYRLTNAQLASIT